MSSTAPNTGGPEAPTGQKLRLQTFRALHYRNFRLLWISLVVSSVGTWMQIVAQSLLILQITRGSALALGIVALAQSSSFFLFALIGGSVDKRRFLLITQSLSMGLAFLLGILTLTGVIQVWMIVLIAFCSGTVLSFDQPTRSSLIPMLVPRKDLMNAISLQSTVFNGAAVVGPALAGITIGLLASAGHLIGLRGTLTGYGGNFLLNGISFFGVLFVLYFIHVPQEAIEQGTEKRGPMLDSIRVALRAVRRDPALPWVLSGYGALLFSASGLGTLSGALTIASLGDFKYKGLLLLISFFLWVSSLIIFAFSRVLWLSLLALLLFGIAQNGVGATVITLAQLRVEPQMRGRVMSLNTLLIMGVRPLGDFPASGMISLAGGPLTVIICALIVGAYSLYLLIGKPVIRSL